MTSPTANDPVLVTRHGGVSTVTLNRPDRLNAIDEPMRRAMVETLPRVLADPAVRVVVITGSGRAFCAGADIAYMKGLLDRRDWGAAEALVEAGRTLVTAIREASKPVIASINGPAAGGGASLALACDVRIASDRASIGQTFNRIGLHPDWGATFFLPRIVGPTKAIELFWSGEMVDSETAAALGMFTTVVSHDRLAETTRLAAESLSLKPPIPTGLAKRATYDSDRAALSHSLDIEVQSQRACFKSSDAAEGLRAFLEKRSAVFTGS